MEEILHQLISSLSRCLQGFIHHPRWRSSSINSMGIYAAKQKFGASMMFSHIVIQCWINPILYKNKSIPREICFILVDTYFLLGVFSCHSSAKSNTAQVVKLSGASLIFYVFRRLKTQNICMIKPPIYPGSRSQLFFEYVFLNRFKTISDLLKMFGKSSKVILRNGDESHGIQSVKNHPKNTSKTTLRHFL